MKLGMDIMPLVTTLKSYFQFSTNSNTTTANKQTFEMGSTTQALFATGPYNDARLQIFRKHK
jgi:hypothetical protein